MAFLDLAGLKKFLEKIKNSDLIFSGKLTLQDSLIFKNAKGIRLLDKNGKEYATLYFRDDAIYIGSIQTDSKISGNIIYFKSKSMVADNNNNFCYRNASNTANIEVMNLDAANKFSVGNDTASTKIRGTSVGTDSSFYCGQNVVVNNENFYYGKNNGGTNKSLLGIDKNNNALVGNDDLVTVLRGTSVHLQNASGTVVTSDRRKKHQIRSLDSKFFKIFMNLRPVYFRMKEGSQKIHIGFIAQEVEEAFKKNHLKASDFAMLDKFQDEAGKWYYGLIYDQFVAWNTYVIQEMYKEMKKNQRNRIPKHLWLKKIVWRKK